MTITTLDDAANGSRPAVPIIKAGIGMAAVGALRGYTPWYVAGNPGPATANAAGVNGAAVSGQVAGMLSRSDPSIGLEAYLARLAMQVTQPGSLWLIDRLWNNSGLVTTSTTLQSITPATLPARDWNGLTDGDGVMAAMEWSATGGAGTPTVTLTYTDQDGNTGATSTMTAVASPPVGTFELFGLAGGDNGIRAPTGITQSATRTSGTMHLVLFRLLAMLDWNVANTGNAIDFLTAGRPRIFDGSVLQLVFFPSTTTAANFIGSYVETHG